MFMSSMYGNPELFVSDSSGARPKRITTYSSWREYFSPSWNPLAKTEAAGRILSATAEEAYPQLYVIECRWIEPGKSGLARYGLRC